MKIFLGTFWLQLKEKKKREKKLAFNFTPRTRTTSIWLPLSIIRLRWLWRLTTIVPRVELVGRKKFSWSNLKFFIHKNAAHIHKSSKLWMRRNAKTIILWWLSWTDEVHHGGQREIKSILKIIVIMRTATIDDHRLFFHFFECWLKKIERRYVA